MTDAKYEIEWLKNNPENNPENTTTVNHEEEALFSVDPE
ncbi:hypothetical protein A2U01_0107384, partial [Trifolium medium]|nr:hypothetical protein [Trifolium medium]